MNLTAHIGNLAISVLANATCKIGPFPDDQIALKGPLILIFNHVNLVEGPVLLHMLARRDVVIMAKVETWKNPIFGPVLDGWDGIKVHRGEADLDAFRKAQQALDQGKILLISPEGTRSEIRGLEAGLGPGHAGVTLLAVRSGAPVQAIGCYDHRGFWTRVYRGFKRVPLNFRAGKPFTKENLDAAYVVLTDVAARQVDWKAAAEAFIADADVRVVSIAFGYIK